jgi:hypothetical protein
MKYTKEVMIRDRENTDFIDMIHYDEVEDGEDFVYAHTPHIIMRRQKFEAKDKVMIIGHDDVIDAL